MTTTNPEIFVEIDNREQKRIKTLTNYLDKQGISYRVDNLPVGDFIFNTDKISICFEYKTISDFVTSTKTKHLHNQINGMLDNYSINYLIIEGHIQPYIAKQRALAKHMKINTEFNIENYLGAISSYSLRVGIHNVDNFSQAKLLMLKLTQKAHLLESHFYNFALKDTRNPATNYLQAIYGIGLHTAELITEHHNINNLQQLLTLSYDDILEVKGIGKTKAKTIITGLQQNPYIPER